MEGAANTFPITNVMLSGVETVFNNAITVAAPVGIALMAAWIGIRAVPKVIKRLGR